MTSSKCPDDSILVELVASRLTEAAAHRWTRHIDACVVCQQKLSQQKPLRGLNQLQQPQRDGQASGHLERAINELKALSDSERDAKAPEAPIPPVQQDLFAKTLGEQGYEFLGIIGQGGMGIVAKAREKSLDRVVAVKFLSPTLANDKPSLQRFIQEARAAARVTHPNVITVHAINESSLPFLVMEYIKGKSLGEYLETGDVMSVDNLIRIGTQLSSALEAAHGKGVVHRDIKPGNVMVNRETGKVLLGDFGLARAIENSKLTRTGTIVGTPAFVAPESLKPDATPDHRSDLFSLGALLYACGTGDSPFQADTLLGTLHQVSFEHPEALSKRATQVPDWLSAVIMKLLAKSPNERFQSAGELRKALQQGVSHATVASFTNVKEATGEVTSTDARRSFSGTHAIVACAILAVLIGFLFAYRNGNTTSVATSNGAKSVETIDSQGNPPADVPLFNLLNREGQPAGNFDELEEAIEQLSAEMTLQIQSNTTIEISQHSIHEDITIAAASGTRPTLRFTPNEADDEEAMLSVRGELRLIGLDLQLPAAIDEESFSLIGMQDEGSIELRDCRLVAERVGYCITSEAQSKVVLKDCFLHAPQSTALALFADDEGSTVLQGTWVTGEVAFFCAGEPTSGLEIRNSYIVCETPFLIALDPASAEEDEFAARRVELYHSLVHATQSLLKLEEEFEDLPSTMELLDLNGQGNTLSGDLFEESDPEDWQAWLDSLKQQGSRYLENPFELDAETLATKLQSKNLPELPLPLQH